MEPIGLAVGVVGLAGLFSTCLEAIDKVDSYKNFGFESRSIMVQFEAEKLLFIRWAQSVGIDTSRSKNNVHSHLKDPETKGMVERLLFGIQEIFGNTEHIVSNLRSVVDAGPTFFPDSILFSDTNPKSQNPDRSISRRSKIAWSFRNKDKFSIQVQYFRVFVEQLRELVPMDGQVGLMGMHNGAMGSDLSPTNDKAPWFSISQQLRIEMEQLEKRNEHETRKELDIWLGTSWTDDAYNNFIQRRLDGTCDWILHRGAFRKWVSSDFLPKTAKMLWIKGPAGHGKTIICARVVQDLSAALESPLAYFFCSSDSESQRDPLIIMKSWISQVISRSRDAFELARDRWEAKIRQYASHGDVVELFRTIVQSIPNCTFIVDGLDECVWAKEEWKTNSPTGFFNSLKKAAAHTMTRILIFSRDEPEIRYNIRRFSERNSKQSYIELTVCPDDIRPDATAFSQSIINKRLADKDETLKQELSQRMVNRCGGMFLWVKMQEDHLHSWQSQKQLEKVIDQAPVELGKLYEGIWNRISDLADEPRLRAFSILRWVAFALRPLTLLEITEALLIKDEDDGEDDLVDNLPEKVNEDYVNSQILVLCGSFLETQNATTNQDIGLMTLHLTHFSAKEYIISSLPAQRGLLITNGRLQASHSSVEAYQGNILAKLCLRYLRFQSASQKSLPPQTSSVKWLFQEYARGSWHHHTREGGSNYKEVIELTNTLFASNRGDWDSWKSWFDINDDKSDLPETQRGIASTSPLFYASLLGLQETVIYLIDEKKLEVNHIDRDNRTALQAAALKGQSSIVKLLLQKEADVMVTNKEGWTALNSASGNGHVEVVKLLLEKGADLTVSTKNGWSPLNNASLNGHVEVVKLLLEKGADFTIPNKDGLTPFYSASGNGHVEVVKLLLEKGADFTIPNNDGWTPLNAASLNGHVEVVKMLLEKRADFTIQNKDGWTPLNAASNEGHVEVVNMLLEKGADFTIPNKDRVTPFYSASRNGHIKVVEMLLGKGGNFAIPNNNGWTPLNAASNEGHVEVVKMLLEKGADFTILNNYRVTPFYSASVKGHVEVVKMLLEKGADFTIPNNDGWTPLNAASNEGHVEVVNILLENGADFTIPNNDGVTPLNVASLNGHVEVVKMLLEKGADFTIPNKDRVTPIYSASLNGHVEVVKMLLEKGADFTILNNNGWTPLNAASLNGHVEVVKMLLEKRADFTIQNKDGWTPLNTASVKGHVEVVKILLEKGADLTVSTKNGWTPLNAASNEGHIKVVKTLLEKGADFTIPNKDGLTPFYSASRNGHVEVVKMLLEKGADFTILNKDRWTPLNAASNEGHVKVVNMLLEKGADFTILNNNGVTPFYSASVKGHVEVVKLLLGKGADFTIPNNDGWSPLNAASLNGHVEVVKMLLEKGADFTIPNNDGVTPFYSASGKGHVEVVKMLLEKGADFTIPNNYKWTPLHAASHNGHVEIVKLLLEKGAIVNVLDKKTQTPLILAAKSGHDSVVAILLHRTILSKFTRSSLGELIRALAQGGCLSQLQLIIPRYHTCYETTDSRGINAAHVAARNGHLSTLELLLTTGTDPYAIDVQGNGILHYAASSTSVEIVRKTIPFYNSTPINLNTWSPLHWACRSGNLDVVKLLLENDIRESIVFTTQPKNRWSPYTIAVYHQNQGLVGLDLLSALDKNASVEAKKHGGYRCDECEFDIYGVRFRCLDCENFDYCFMCRLNSHLTHPNHRFEEVLWKD